LLTGEIGGRQNGVQKSRARTSAISRCFLPGLATEN
jgi:hypothetical protein